MFSESLALLDKHAIASPASPFPSPSSSFVPPPLSSSLKRRSFMGSAPVMPAPPEPPAIVTIPFCLSSSPDSSISSSPSTTAFATPASSLASADPSNPPSPSVASPPPSTLPGYIAAIGMGGAVSTRPAPPSPALSRRQSTKSTAMTKRPASVGVLDPPPMTTTTVTGVATLSEEPLSTTTASTSTSAAEPQTTPRQPMKIRDYAFELSDDRFHGLGPFVPKWNKPERVNRVLLNSVKDNNDEEGREKKKERRKRKKQKKTVNGWSDDSDEEDSSDGRRRGSGGGSDSDSGMSGRSSDDESESESEDGGGGGGGGALLQHHHQGEEDPFWGGFRFGRLSWHHGLGGVGGGGGLDSSSEKGREDEEREPGGFPTRMDLDRNFGQEGGHEMDSDYLRSQLPSSSDPYPYESDHYQGGGERGAASSGYADDYYQEYQDGYQQDYHEELPAEPLLPGLYRALYAFEPEGTAEMGLEEDQVVRVVGRGGGAGWAVVMDEREGRKGGHALVPESYLEMVRLDVDGDGDDDDDDNDEHA